jgi:glycosyltransferase involved in cell wall biosynthesis
MRWVSSVHGIYSAHWSGKRILPLFNFVWRRADACVAISQAVKDWLVKVRGIPAEGVTVIHYGIDTELFIRPDFNLRQLMGLDRRPLLGSMGRLDPVKGHEYLIRAMPVVLREVPNASLLIAGHDASGYGKVLQALIDEQRLNGHVQLVGFQGDVPSFLHALDVFALASRSEGFGQVVIEAMAAGRPVVASRFPPFTEIVVDGVTGLLVEPDNPEAFAHAIFWLLAHPEERWQMGSSGQNRVREQFSADRMADETLSLYETLVPRDG